MFGDFLQGLIARRMVKAHARTWMLLYDVPNEGETKQKLALAVEIDPEDGTCVLPAAVELIDYTEATKPAKLEPVPVLKAVP